MPNEPFTLYDPNTDECPSPADLLTNIEQLSDDEVLDLVERATALAKDLKTTLSALIETMTGRMKDRDATLLDTLNFTGKLEPESIIVYDEAGLRTKLRPLLTAEGFKKVFVPQDDKLDRKELARLEKLGSDFKTIISAARSKDKGPSKFSYERKPDPKPEGMTQPEGGTSSPAG